MKKTFTLLSLLLCLQFITAQAQQNIYVWKQGSVRVMTTSEVDSLTFDVGAWLYNISCSTPVSITAESARAIVSVSLSTDVKNIGAKPEIGLCFSMSSQQPTIRDYKVKLGNSTGDYPVTMVTYYPGTQCWYRAYVKLLDHTFYSDVQTFTTLGESLCTKVNGHEFVDLGLPSGLKWAICNVGTNMLSESGDHFAWGEVESTDNYDWYYWSSYKWANDNGNYNYDTHDVTITKYNSYDGKSTLDAEDDAATQNWGEGCRMPTVHEFKELIDNCTFTETEIYGVYGYKFTSKNNSGFVFFPGANYWSSSLYSEYYSYVLYIHTYDSFTYPVADYALSRNLSFPVRAVCQ